LATFSLRILNPKHVVFEGDVESVFLPGDAGEFELLAYHVPIVSLLKEGEIVVDWKTRIPIKRGMVRFLGEECVVLLEQQAKAKEPGKEPAVQKAPGA
jgi:F-type H+-transporting ATPase subunit epsilon